MAERTAPLGVLFHVAAGPRLGYGHLRRATTLVDALGCSAAVHVRGDVTVPAHISIVNGSPAAVLRRRRPRVLVVDEPRRDEAIRWIDAARRLAIPSVSIHDLGMAPVDSDVAIDGSLVSRRRWPAGRVLLGPRYAVIRKPRISPRHRLAPSVATVGVSLGGGVHRHAIDALVRQLIATLPDSRIRVARGLHGMSLRQWSAGVEVIDAPDGLAALFAAVDLAIVGGGVSLYEAVAAGVPTVAVSMVPAQARTVRAFARAGLAQPAGAFVRDVHVRARRVGDAVRLLAADTNARRRFSRRGPRVVDGRGAARVARVIRAMARLQHD